MVFADVPGGAGYLRTTFTGNSEAEKVQDYLNHMHPLVATMHALFDQQMTDSHTPTVLLDDLPIDRTAGAGPGAGMASFTTEVRAEGDDAAYVLQTAPTRMATRPMIFHQAIAASRTSQRVRLYGIEDSMDRAIDKALADVLDQNERALHFAVGNNNSPTYTQGLMSWCATTGLERRHSGTPLTTIGDGINAMPSKFWSSFYNAQGTQLSRDILYDQIFGVPWQIGHQIDGAVVLCGNQMMKVFADLPRQPGRTAINERTIPARDQAVADIITVIETPAYGTFYLMLDRFLSVPGVTIDYANNAYGASRGGNGNMASSALTICNVDQTILSVMTSEFQILAIDNISYRDLAVDGDYSAGMVFSEKALQCQHPFAICGGTNLNN